ncbi:MAG: ABC transporter ATP-binding protein [Rhizobiales bacterium]|nr:ABC transporter ATP-binding protein [Hyphomicrobiales bacterium]
MNKPASKVALKLDKVRRSFTQGHRTIEVLRGLVLDLHAGEIIALVGPSGAGKSTLLQIAGLLEEPSSGKVFVDGVDCSSMSDAERTNVRRNKIGFIYQSHRLLPEFSAEENIMLPQRIAGRSKADAKARAAELLALMGLEERGDHRPSELSGGEQQRTAFARAIANGPEILLADEPTGNLDRETGDRVFNSLVSIVKETNLGTLIATHNMELAARMDRVVSLSDGVLTEV